MMARTLPALCRNADRPLRRRTDAASTPASSNIRPTICRPTGNPSLVKPQGTLAAGCWVRLKGKLNGVHCIQARPSSSSGDSWPTSKAGRRDRRRQEEIVALHELAQLCCHRRRAPAWRRDSPSWRIFAPSSAIWRRPGSSCAFFSSGRVAEQIARAGPPQRLEDVGRDRRGRIDLFDMRAHRFEALHGRGDQRLDLGHDCFAHSPGAG